ncbi:hypothetical protein BD324DRAFT_640712 [Kockovaella imperatae]|uniref:Glycosyltransferase 61 catalytic domain-containing protein n=1 Tax=Kockovaella imperatae TaxID=4999 RepID=A0A1Y1UUX8_9TREE|nr:hypothetical protein BD324DRAFT_640712 [Kockovaella imperatae]ORX41015.1 hypothetical protein BD324DRAFT_640712 [Kockovaella imperatae]
MPGGVSLPAYLSGSSSSPPRSPHPAPPSGFSSFFAPNPSHTSGPSRHRVFRPTRRDILLCLLTLFLSYLLFHPSDHSLPPRRNSRPKPSASDISTSGSLKTGEDGRIGFADRLSGVTKWGSLFSGGGGSGSGEAYDHDDESSLSCAVGSLAHEKTFGESVQTHGFIKAPALGDGDAEDEGEDSSDAVVADGDGEDDENDTLDGSATVLKGFQPGWTLVDKLYLYNGSFYVVTDDREQWPELRLMTSTGLPANGDPGNEEAREPKGNEILFITPAHAAKLWGHRVYQMDGTTWLFNDGQFIDHYYHFVAELLMGTWRTYCSLDPDITAAGETSLPPPKRIWFLHQAVNEWRDRPRFNSLVLFALFPSVSILYPEDFADMAVMTASTRPKAFVFERALLADRSAAFRGQWTAPTSRTVASALQVGKTSRWWWEPIRRQILRYSGVSEDVIARNLEGYGSIDPAMLGAVNTHGVAVGDSGIKAGLSIGAGLDTVEPLAPPGTYTPIVTYISRQKSRRHLTPESHDNLVSALQRRAQKANFELIIVEAEHMTKEEQVALAARTTIMLGVHGNGLTHLVWMPATPRSAVIEMFFKGGFARDYQWTAHALGIRHFAFQHDQFFTAPNLPNVDYPEGFQGEQITVDGEKVADVIEARLAGRL